MTPRLLLYVAGPYTHDDPVENTHRAIKTASAIYRMTPWVPVVPHLSLLWHLVDPQPIEFWYEYDLHLLDRCSAIVRLPGRSTGADAELAHARSIRIRELGFSELPDMARRYWTDQKVASCSTTT